MNFADELNQYLTTNNIINGATGWLGLTDYLDDTDVIVGIFNDESLAPIKSKNSPSIERPKATIQVRAQSIDNNGYLSVDNKMNAIAAALDLLDTLTIDGTLYYNIMTTTTKKFLGRDDNQRPMMEIKISAMAEAENEY